MDKLISDYAIMGFAMACHEINWMQWLHKAGGVETYDNMHFARNHTAVEDMFFVPLQNTLIELGGGDLEGDENCVTLQTMYRLGDIMQDLTRNRLAELAGREDK